MRSRPVLVLRLTTILPASENDAEQSTDQWVVVGHINETLMRFSLLGMVRCPQEDRDDLIGLSVEPDLDGPFGLLHLLSSWQLILNLDLQGVISMQAYEFFAQANRRVGELRPWIQRVKQLGVASTSLWRGRVVEEAAIEAAAKASKQRQSTKRTAKSKRVEERSPQDSDPLDADINAIRANLDGALSIDDGGDPIVSESVAENSVPLGDMSAYAEPDASENVPGVASIFEQSSDEELWVVPEDFDLEGAAAEADPTDGDPPQLPMCSYPLLETCHPGKLMDATEEQYTEWRSLVEARLPDPLPVSFSVKLAFGRLVYYTITRNVVAELPVSVSGCKTHLTRKVRDNPANPFQGRPVGESLVWMRDVDTSLGRDWHREVFLGSYDARAKARDQFAHIDHPSVDFILFFERVPRFPAEPLEPRL